MQRWQCRIAPSLGGGFAGHPNDVWGTTQYTDPYAPCVFFGMYGLNDYQAYWNHKGNRAILWAGSDIRNLLGGYWLDKNGEQRIKVQFDRYTEHYVENSLEQIALYSLGIEAKVVPSFLGDVNDYKVQVLNNRPRYYTSVSGDDFKLYGWDEIDDWADRYPGVEFHLYGNTKAWLSTRPNVIVHGRMEQAKMDSEIKSMTGALRLTRFDGFSEILAKSVLWGQQPVSPYIHYPHIATTLDEVKTGAREYYLKNLNQYPWNVPKS